MGEIEIDFNQPEVYAGLFVCSHNPDVVEEVIFSNTRLIIPAKPDFVPYRDYIGSRLEILDVETGLRSMVYESAQPFEAPNWSRDGKFLVVNHWFNSNRSGSMEIWRMNADGSETAQVTRDPYQNWFPHQSPDGRYLVFLSYPPEVKSDDHPYYRQVMLRLLDLQSGKIKVIAHLYGGQGTINVPSWSPDSKKIAFVSNTGTPE